MTRIRDEILHEIERIKPFDALEKAHHDDVVAWMGSGVEIFRLEKPATPPKHLVSYFVVVDEDGCLLVDHKKAQKWLPSGGHVEVGEHPRETVRREIREELAMEADFAHDGPLMVTVTETVGTTAGHWDVSLWYVVRGKRGGEIVFDREEFEDVRWFDWGEIPANCDPHLGRFVGKWRGVGS